MNILLFGLGAVGRTLLLIFKRKRPRFLGPGSTLLVVDKDDRRGLLEALGVGEIFAEVEFVRAEVRADNYGNLGRLVAEHATDLFVDATYGVRTIELLRLLDARDVPYINSSVEEWDVTADNQGGDPDAHSLSKRQREIAAAAATMRNRPTSLLDMGVNPGLISAMTKRAVRHFHRRVFGGEPADVAAGAARLDVRAALIAELDCQISNRPRRRGEFCNTWSPDGYVEEAFAPAEYTDRGIGVVVSPVRSFYHLVYSRTPSSEYVGFAVRHSEAITIGRLLQGSAPTPPATVFYAYRSCDASVASLFETQKTFAFASKRTLTDDLVDGTDEVGILLLTPAHGAHWCGTVQSIHDARKLFPGYEAYINASTVQTAAGYFAGISWIVENPGRGVSYPEALSDDFVFDAIGDLIAPIFDGPVPFDLSKKPARRLDAAGPAPEPFSFESFRV
jgi:homospermidine synthase